MPLRVAVIAAGAVCSPDAEPFFGDDWEGDLRNDWDGDLGIALCAEETFAVTALGRRAAQGLQGSAEVALWSADSEATLAVVHIGPSSARRGAYAFELLHPHVVLHAGKEYRLTQRCTKGMPDPWLDTPAGEGQSSKKHARFLGGVYNFFTGYPSFCDGALRRGGMINFEIAPLISALELEETAPVRELKLRLEEQLGVPPLLQRLHLGGEGESLLLDDDACCLRTAGVSDGALVHLVVQSGGFLITASKDSSVRLWCLATGSCQQTYFGHSAAVLSLDTSPSFHLLATASADCSARLWDVETGRCIWVLEGHSASVFSVRFSAGPFLLTASDDRSARLWHTAEQSPSFVLRHERGEALTSAAFSPDGELAATAFANRMLWLWRVETGEFVRSLCVQNGTLVKVSFPVCDSSRLLTVCADAREPVLTWSVAEGQRLQVFSDGTMVHEATFSPDGSEVLTACADRTVRLWAADSGVCVLELRHNAQVLAAVYSSDGGMLATVAADHVLHVWRLPDGVHSGALVGHNSKVVSACFIPENWRLVSTSVDGTARLWDVLQTQCVSILSGHSDAITSFAVSP